MKSLPQLKFEADEALREYKEAMNSRKVFRVTPSLLFLLPSL